jgi:mxaA protein
MMKMRRNAASRGGVIAAWVVSCAAAGAALAAVEAADEARTVAPARAHAATVWQAADATGGPSIQASEPRAYGYQVGDLVRREVRIHAPSGWRLDESSLPRPGGRGQAIELRRVDSRTLRVGAGTQYELQLEYQVFLSPAAVRTLEIAPLRLRLDGPGRTQELLVEAWPITVAPLVAAAAPARRGLGELQPDREPPRVDTEDNRSRLLIYAGIAALLSAALAVQTFGLPWRPSRRLPFGRAWRALQRLPSEPGEAEWRAACRDFHAALNQHAGGVLFEAGLARFVAERPAFAALHDELLRFMHASRVSFFSGAERSAGDAAWLVSLARRCHDAERGLG